MDSCKSCTFATIENDKQTGCYFNRIELLNPSYESDDSRDGFYQFDRLCLLKRKDGWEHDKTIEERAKLSRTQIMPNIGFCILDDSDNPDHLENIINSFKDIEYPKNRIGIVIYSKFGKPASRIPKLISELKASGISYVYAVFSVAHEDVFENETSVFEKLADATFLAKISSLGETNLDINKPCFILDSLINDKLAKVLVFNRNGINYIYKSMVSSEYLKYKDYELMEKEIVKKVSNTEFYFYEK